jgi:hypothetical protein
VRKLARKYSRGKRPRLTVACAQSIASAAP